MAYRGRYHVKNPSKYIGDPTKVIYRSGLELRVMNHLDLHPDVIGWNSESVIVPYRSPLDGRVHRYFPDLLLKKRDPSGKIETFLIEIKPKSQCSPPKRRSRSSRKYLTEVATWGINSAKWAAAELFCQKRGWKFIKLTEKEIEGLR